MQIYCTSRRKKDLKDYTLIQEINWKIQKKKNWNEWKDKESRLENQLPHGRRSRRNFSPYEEDFFHKKKQEKREKQKKSRKALRMMKKMKKTLKSSNEENIIKSDFHTINELIMILFKYNGMNIRRKSRRM